MKAINVLRFVLLGVGVTLIPLGIMVLCSDYKSAHPAAEIFIVVAYAALGIALITAGVGCIIASIVMFVMYHKRRKSLKEKAALNQVEDKKTNN